MYIMYINIMIIIIIYYYYFLKYIYMTFIIYKYICDIRVNYNDLTAIVNSL